MPTVYEPPSLASPRIVQHDLSLDLFYLGIDIIGKVTPKASNMHEFILVTVDYFTKWVEAKSYEILNANKVAKFIGKNIILFYGVPHELVSDNGLHF